VALFLVVAWAVFLTVGVAAATAKVPRLLFPVIGHVQYQNDFGDARGQGSHQGNDIMAAWKSPTVAVEAGTVRIWTSSARAGCMLYLYGASGTTYLYIHLNNDRTSKSEDSGGCKRGVAYAPGLDDGQRVRAGQLIAYVGDSGDAEGVGHHLHFELHPGDGNAVSPYRALRGAEKLLFAVPEGQASRGAAGNVVLTLTATVVSYVPPKPPQEPEPPNGGEGGGESPQEPGGGGSSGGGSESVPPPPPPPPSSRLAGTSVAGKGSLTVRVTRVRLSSGGSWRVTRQVVLTLGADAVLERSSGKKVRAADLREGAAVTVTTAPVKASLAAQRARAGVLKAAHVLIR
jgi:hypothetical protein